MGFPVERLLFSPERSEYIFYVTRHAPKQSKSLYNRWPSFILFFWIEFLTRIISHVDNIAGFVYRVTRRLADYKPRADADSEDEDDSSYVPERLLLEILFTRD